jgi:hypothetical protein
MKTSWLSVAQVFNRAEELEKHVEQKALAESKLNEFSVDYMGNTSNNRGAQKAHNRGRGKKHKINGGEDKIILLIPILVQVKIVSGMAKNNL